MDNNLEMTLLFDLYGDLLTEKQRTCFDLYYNQDLSLAEIAASEGISRQGVHDSISRSEAALRNFEAALGVLHRERLKQQALDRITAAVSQLPDDPATRQTAEEIMLAVNSLKE